MAAVDKDHFSVSHISRLSSVTLGLCSISRLRILEIRDKVAGEILRIKGFRAAVEKTCRIHRLSCSRFFASSDP